MKCKPEEFFLLEACKPRRTYNKLHILSSSSHGASCLSAKIHIDPLAKQREISRIQTFQSFSHGDDSSKIFRRIPPITPEALGTQQARCVMQSCNEIKQDFLNTDMNFVKKEHFLISNAHITPGPQEWSGRRGTGSHLRRDDPNGSRHRRRARIGDGKGGNATGVDPLRAFCRRFRRSRGW